MVEQLRIELFGGLRVRWGPQTHTRFRTQKTGALLAYLAYYPQRAHIREVLIESLWPESTDKAGRLSLRVALSTLRHLLEPPGVPPGSFLVTDGTTVQLNPAQVTTDVAEFETSFQEATVKAGEAREQLLAQVVELYNGPLLAGYYESWIPLEEQRLEELFFRAVRMLIDQIEQAGKTERALSYAQRAVSIDPLREEARRELMRLYVAVGELSAALREYHEFEQVLEQQWGETPAAATRELAKSISQRAGKSTDWKSRSTNRKTHSSIAAPLPPQTAPTLISPEVTAPTPTLPAPLTRFFGRDEECGRLKEILLAPEIRLVTLTGAGGSGKTRLALEVAWQLAQARATQLKEQVQAPPHTQAPTHAQAPIYGPIFFVPLADVDAYALSGTASCGVALREALGLPASAQGDPLEQVIAALAAYSPLNSPLLILDNFEHLVTVGAALVQKLLERVPHLTCLVTSRQRLGLLGEREWMVLPLPVPSVAATPEQLAHNESVQLFQDRTQAIRPQFQVTASNAPLVARLCQQLEGIPLALELAAARAGSLSVGEMVADLEKRLDVFSSRQSNVATRHRTLRTAIDWSYQLLSPPLRDFFTGLGIFPSGCTAAAVEAVCQVPTALVYLEQLRESSLLLLEENAAESGGGMRFRLLEMIREYALDHLPPERQEELAQRHAAYYLQFAEEANKHLSGPDTRIWLNRLEAEHENLRAALSWSLEQAPDLALQLCGALGQFWQVRGHIHEGRAYLERALTKTPDAAPAQRALALRHLGMLAWSQGDFTRATEVQQQARTLYGLAKDRIGIGKTLAHLSIINRDQGDFVAARALATEALNILQDSEQKLDQAQALFTLGSAACCLNDYLTARSCFAEALSIHRELGNQRGIALLLSNLGAVAGYEGDLTAARRCHEESLALRRELEDKTGIVYSLTDLGNILQQDGDYEQARVLYAESLNMRRELGDRDGMAHTLYLLGLVAAEADDRATARALYLQDLKVLHEISNKGAVMRPLEALARLETVNHSPASLQRAAKLWGAAYACRTASQRLMTPQELTHHEAELAAVRSALGKRAFDRAYQEGSHLTWEQAVDYALNECEAETP